MRLTGHVIGVLKQYMWDLVEQARQEERAQQSFGYRSTPYGSDDAISDLLAILDDRIESEGSQMGLPEGMLHFMWTTCNEARVHVNEAVWLESHVASHIVSRARTRELTYQALMAYIEK
ncbi:MAG: hypothetical protein E6K60_01100 [Nitrospirae bacterium]|nr:MAG: hypothetical protein E6K60_01100 [Nitrospirota bacterium]